MNKDLIIEVLSETVENLKSEINKANQRYDVSRQDVDRLLQCVVKADSDNRSNESTIQGLVSSIKADSGAHRMAIENLESEVRKANADSEASYRHGLELSELCKDRKKIIDTQERRLNGQKKMISIYENKIHDYEASRLTPLKPKTPNAIDLLTHANLASQVAALWGMIKRKDANIAGLNRTLATRETQRVNAKKQYSDQLELCAKHYAEQSAQMEELKKAPALKDILITQLTKEVKLCESLLRAAGFRQDCDAVTDKVR